MIMLICVPVPETLYTLEDLADRWKIKPKSALAKARRIRLHPIDLGGRVKRYRIEDIERKEAALSS